MDAKEDPTNLSYDDQMDQMLLRLNEAALHERRKKRLGLLFVLLIMLVMGLMIYHATPQAGGGGEFMGFLRDLM